MPVTYFCTDSLGHTYHRPAAAHVTPRYVWAMIMRRSGDDGPVPAYGLSFSAEYSVVDRLARKYRGRYDAQGRLIVPEIVPVRAYLGRLKYEPRAIDPRTGSDPRPSAGTGPGSEPGGRSRA